MKIVDVATNIYNSNSYDVKVGARGSPKRVTNLVRPNNPSDKGVAIGDPNPAYNEGAVANNPKPHKHCLSCSNLLHVIHAPAVPEPSAEHRLNLDLLVA